MKTARLASAVVALVLFAGCGDDSEANEIRDWVKRVGDLPACADVVGQVATAQQWDDGLCLDGDTVHGSTFYDCADGRTLAAAGPGWGYHDDVVNAYGPDEGPGMPPPDALTGCNG